MKARRARPSDGLLSEGETAAYLGVADRTLVNWRNNGLIPFYKLGRRVLYRREAVDRALEERYRRGAL